jgi:outer membrane protein OmpA-like peptidoglycan-associated protein
MERLLVAIAIGVIALLSSAPIARAQRLGAQRFGPAGSEDGIFETEGADRRPQLVPYVALWGHYALNPLIAVDGNRDRIGSPVEHLLGFDLVASIAVWEGLEFGAALPVTALALGDDGVAGSVGLPAAYSPVLGDVSVRVAYRIRLAEHTAIALHVPVLFPTSPDDNVLSLGFGVRPTIAFMQRAGPVEILVNAFVLARESARASDFRGGSEIGGRLGVRIDVSGQWRTALLAEVTFSTAFESPFGEASTPAEARGGLEHWLDRHWRIGGMAGAGLGPGVGAPDFRTGIFVSYGDNVPWRPRPSGTDGDRDGDHIRDRDDRCPNRAEDPDGFQDRDGCPEDDNDRDGIADWDDACPNIQESRNDFRDDDGCPDYIRVDEGEIITFEPVHFRTGSDEILPRSYPMLREIAELMTNDPRIHVRVEGHTDSEGDDHANLELSRARAGSVRRFLVRAGVAESQLDSAGFGETRPVASNATPQGRFRNRRVDFHITMRGRD